MKLNRKQIQELIKAVEILSLSIDTGQDDNEIKKTILRYFMRICRITGNVKEAQAIVNLCIMGEADKVLAKLRAKYN